MKQVRQAMRKVNGINFNNTKKHHDFLVIRIYFEKNLNYPKVARILVKQKSPCKSQFTEYFQNQVLYISNIAGNI